MNLKMILRIIKTTQMTKYKKKGGDFDEKFEK